MTVEMFKTVIAEVSKVTQLITLHLMGDPLVHPKLGEILDLCSQYSIKVFFVTNGLLLKDPDLLLHPALQQVSFSLHSFSDNFPQKSPTDYLNRIFQFTELAFEKRPKLYINYRLWNLKSRSGIEHQNVFLLNAIQERFKVDLTQPLLHLRKKNLQVKNYLSLHFDEEFTWPALHLPVLNESGTCYGLKSHFGILVDGTVVPCCLDKEGGIPLGNVLHNPLNEILSSERSVRILQGFKNHQLVEDLCQRCQFIERFQP